MSLSQGFEQFLVRVLKSFEDGNFHQVDLEQQAFEGRAELQIIGSLANIRDYHLNATKGVLAACEGEFRKTWTPHGEEDLLGHAVKRMLGIFREVSKQANVIAGGDYTAEIAPRSDKDELGLALRSMTRTLQSVALAAEAVADGDLDVAVESKGDQDLLAKSFNRMTVTLKEARDKSAAEDWLKTGAAMLNDVMRGEKDVSTLSREIIAHLAEYTDARLGAVFLADESQSLELAGAYAYAKEKGVPDRFAFGEGLVGQAAVDGKVAIIKDVPEDYIAVSSSLGRTSPRNIAVLPFQFEDQTVGVIELGALGEISGLHLQLLSQVSESIAIAFYAARSRAKQRVLLEETRSQASELLSQQEELQVANEELEEQTLALTQSEESLKAQQEELQATNEELEENIGALEHQRQELEQGRLELTQASRYKSEFLANMSHELRTPLNSLLLLARSLSENREGNLTEDQVESAEVIYQGGNELLSLINEILDLSKIEAGRMDLSLDTVFVADLASAVRVAFEHVAADKGLALTVSVDPDAPAGITTDRKRVDQVLKNLVSNSIKFTERGSVDVVLGPVRPDAELQPIDLDPAHALAISVRDTGIGIAPDQQRSIFEAFQQVDGTAARKHSGTGLGLSISRELARLLGGEIHVSSELDKGAIFTVFLPVRGPEIEIVGPALSSEMDVGRSVDQAPGSVASIPDDREQIKEGDRAILLIEDDAKFAAILAKHCHSRGFKVLAAATGEAGLDLARRFRPQGVVLDLVLPGMDGWGVLSALKNSTHTRHIPVHIVSVLESSTQAQRQGAVGHRVKPLDSQGIDDVFRRIEQVSAGVSKRVLVVEDDDEIRRRTISLLGNGDVKVDEASTGEQALKAILSTRYDCVILDLGLPDFDGYELLTRVDREGVELPPVIVYTARDLTWEEGLDLSLFSDSIIIKDVRSEERLLDEVSLFLHRVVADMAEDKRRMIAGLHDSDAALRDKKVLVVDDDMRTLFALSKILSDRGMLILKAENGQKALDRLAQEPDVDIVLMDIMMPVLDGYKTMERIRAQDQFKRLPIIALTAKAMRGDQERCVAAGASDYLPKPVDQDRLVSMLRVWLHR